MKERLTLRACRRCATPTIYTDALYPITCDPTNLSAEAEARAWLADTRTYLVQSFGRRQHLTPRHPSPAAITALTSELLQSTTRTITVLAEHTCPGIALTPTDLADWQPRDRSAFQPRPRPAPPSEEIPF